MIKKKNKTKKHSWNVDVVGFGPGSSLGPCKQIASSRRVLLVVKDYCLFLSLPAKKVI